MNPPPVPETPPKSGRLRDLIRRWRSSPRENRRLALRVWFSEHLQPNDMQRTLFWAGVVGVLGALVSVAFRQVTDGFLRLMTSQKGDMVELFRKLPDWQRIAMPAVGGVLAGCVILLGKRLGRSRNTTDYMEAVVLGNGTVSFRSSMVKTVSAMFSVASGGSIGRVWEAPGARQFLPALRTMLVVFNTRLHNSLSISHLPYCGK